jgi:predicted lysophospholipase L1 biosynthesis ABC-type transport system permease subunit
MYWTYATRSQLRGGQRSLLAIFCIAVGVMAIVALQLVSQDITQGLTGDERALNGGDLAIQSSSAPLTASQLGYFDQLRANGQITNFTAVDSGSGEFHLANHGSVSRFFTVNAVNPAQFPITGAPQLSDTANGNLQQTLSGESVVITTTLAQTLDLHIGDTERLYLSDGRSLDVTVAGILASAGFFRGPMLLVNLASVTALPSVTGQPAGYTAIYANTPGHTDASATTAERLIQARFPLATIQTTKQALASNAAQAQQIEYFLQMVGLLALLIGGVGIVNTMQVLLRRRRTEIATLKTVGYRRGDLYALFGLEAALVGLTGGVIGAAAGIGVRYLASGLIGQALQMALPTTLDLWTVAAGVLVGFGAALIFSLLPIVQAAEARPQAVLRESAEGVTWKGRLMTGFLLALLIALFSGLALSILKNVAITALAIGGAVVALVALSLLIGAVVFLVSKIPTPERFSWPYAALLVVALMVTGALTLALPSVGVLLLIATLVVAGVAILPKSARIHVKMALRNIGRQKARGVMTMIALYIGVFSISLIIVLGQNISLAINSYLLSGNAMNAEVIAGAADHVAVARQIAATPGVAHETVNSFTNAIPVAVNGQPIATFIQRTTASGAYTATDIASVMNGAQGYDLASGQTLDLVDTPVTAGRALTASDAGTLNAMLPVAASQAPTNLRLGATITLMSQEHPTPITLTVVGFYSSKIPQLGPALTDTTVVNTLSGGAPEYGFRLRVNPATTDATLATIQNAVPEVVTYNFTDFAAQYAMLLGNLTSVLYAVTSLALLASVIIIANTVGLAMMERRRELGILKAVGYTSGTTLGEVATENAITGFTGAALALLIVTGAATVLGKTVFNLSISVSTVTELVVVAATVAVCALVATAVAWQAARVRPVSVLRYE